MARHLSMLERRIDGPDENAYIASLAGRVAAATEAEAHFWVFSHASDPHRYVEFVEGANASKVAELSGVSESALWRAVEVK